MGDYVGTGELARALGWDAKTLREAARAGVDWRLDGHVATPGGSRGSGHLRWPKARAAAVVRAFGREPPPEWEALGAETGPKTTEKE